MSTFDKYLFHRPSYQRLDIRREISTVDTLKSYSQPQGSTRTFIVLGLQAQ